MKWVLSIWLTHLMAFSALSDPPELFTPHSDGTQYESLLEKYDGSDATLPAIQDAEGWWSGRCYRKSAQSQPLASVLAVTSKSEDHGPLFPIKKSYKILMAVKSEATPNWFDTLNEDKTLEIERFLTSGNPLITTAREIEGSWVSQLSNHKVEFQLKKLDPYYLARIVALADTETMSEGDIPTACYYFKNLEK